VKDDQRVKTLPGREIDGEGKAEEGGDDGKDADDVFGRSPASVQGLVSFGA
jgi:hypothetical protein